MIVLSKMLAFGHILTFLIVLFGAILSLKQGPTSEWPSIAYAVLMTNIIFFTVLGLIFLAQGLL